MIQNPVENFSAKATRWETEKDRHAQIWSQCLGKTTQALPVSDSIEVGFERSFGPFGVSTFKNEVAFKLHVHRRIKADVHRMDVRTDNTAIKFTLMLPLVRWMHAELSAIRARTRPAQSTVINVLQDAPSPAPWMCTLHACPPAVNWFSPPWKQRSWPAAQQNRTSQMASNGWLHS